MVEVQTVEGGRVSDHTEGKSGGGTRRPPAELTHHPAAPAGAPRTPHSHAPGDVLKGLGSSTAGLASEDVACRSAHFGPNSFPEPEPTHPVLRFLAQFNNAIIYVLLAAAAVKLLTQDFVDASVILAVAVINAVIGFVQEGQAEKALRSIRHMLSPRAIVRRDGAWSEVEAAALVPGDIVRVHAGDRAPADARVLEAREVRADEAALTGESVPVAKQVGAVAHDASLADRHNMLHAGSVVVAGRSVAVVTATGPHTELGRVQQLVRGVGRTGTPLTRSISRLGRQLTGVVLALTAVMVAVGLFVHGGSPAALISAAIAFAVAAIPEGLPAVVTITLALGVRQMAARRAITRRLTTVETLGSVTVICTDKTGTLTKNEMTVRTAETTASRYTVTGDGYDPVGSIVSELEDVDAPSDDITALALALGLCNDARLVRDDRGTWRVVGDPTEGALASFTRKAGVDLSGWDRRGEIPFSADLAYMATVDEAPSGERILSVKGAPDRVLMRCETQSGRDGRSEALDRTWWASRVDAYTTQGMRVLAAARREVPNQFSLAPDQIGSLQMLGIVGIADPPRTEAIAAIAECRDAGIRVKMITGDHALTARSIAVEMGLVAADCHVLTGADIDTMDDEELAGAVDDVDVFARTSPEHKLRIVTALQAQGDVVAMTGDGVNDAPALARADVGVAMGRKGTEAAKDASDIVLADDDFATIEGAVREGRRVYDNLRKSVVFILATTLGQALVVFAAVVVGFPDPLQPTQILWVNLVTAVTLSLAFAYDPVEPGTMSRPPRPPGESILSHHLFMLAGTGVVVAAATTLAFFAELARGVDVGTARAVAVTVLVVAQVAVLFNLRMLRRSSLTWRAATGNRVIWVSIAVLAVLQTVYTYLPPFQLWFGSQPLGAVQWVTAFAYGFGTFIAVEGVKALTRLFSKRPR
jgi:magnesium-transporting ATPase (P-type)